MTEKRDFHAEDLAGAYALGALDPDERLLVDVHIQTCPQCARTVEEAVLTASLLAHAVDSAAPRSNLEERLFARIAQEEGSRSAAPTKPPQSAALPRPSAPRQGTLRRILVRRVLPVAAAIVLLVGVGTWNLQLQAQVAHQQRIDALIANAEAYSLTPAPGSQMVRGKVFVDPSSDQVLLAVDDLPALPADQAYQLWLVRPDGKRDNGGVFRADSQGRATVLITTPSSLDSYASLGVTKEPAGGSPGPTGPKVMGCKLSDN